VGAAAYTDHDGLPGLSGHVAARWLPIGKHGRGLLRRPRAATGLSGAT
jgi:hypothetical protein